MSNIIGRRIRNVRLSKKITQRNLAQDAGISTSYMNLIESGRRPIAGNLLNKIAKILDTDSAQLSDDASISMIDSVWPLVEHHEISKADVEDLLIRHPKWGHIVQSLGHEIESLKGQLNEVANSLSLESGFSKTFHELISRISSIRSTASILNTQGDLTKEKDSQFRHILHSEARNASIAAKDLMSSFEQRSRSLGSDVLSLQRLSSQLYEDQYHIPFLEDFSGNISQADLIEGIKTTYGDDISESPILLRLFFTMAKDIHAIPKKKFIDAAQNCGWDIETLSVVFDAPLDRILRRIAMLSQYSELPRVSLNIYDQMGAAWLMSPVSLSSSYKKIGCAYWPIYDRDSGTDRLSSKTIKVGKNEKIRAYSAHGLPNTGENNRSEDRISTMISYTSEREEVIKDILTEAHIDCASCNKTDCHSRRDRSISL